MRVEARALSTQYIRIFVPGKSCMGKDCRLVERIWGVVRSSAECTDKGVGCLRLNR